MTAFLTTDEFQVQARRSPSSLMPVIRELAAAPADSLGAGPSARRLEDGRVLVFSGGARSYRLWYVLAPSAFGEGGLPFAQFSRDELVTAGVPVEKVDAIRTADSLEAIWHHGLGNSVAGGLCFRLLQTVLGRLPTDEDLRRRAENVAHLNKFLHGDLRELLLNLDDQQNGIVDLEANGAILVRGVAGSGKTSVLIQRLVRRSQEQNGRAIFLSYNKPLATTALQLLRFRGLDETRCEVHSVHGFCRSFFRTVPMLGGEEQQSLIARAIEKVRPTEKESAIWTYPDAFWKDELHLIKGRIEGGLDEYLDLPRIGAGRPLDAKRRRLVWQVFEVYEQLRGRRFDFDDLLRATLERFRNEGDQAPKYDHVVVDEAQDLPVVAMRLVAHLAKTPSSLVIAYDPAQSIFEKGFRWKDCGIVAHGRRSFDLKKNYRNTVEILEAARPLLAGAVTEESDEQLEPERSVRSGHAPRVLWTKKFGEADGIADDIREKFERHGVPPQNIAVLAFPNRVLHAVHLRLEARGISVQKIDHDARTVHLDEASVKVLGVMSAKGLEFPIVYLIATRRNFNPPRGFGDSERVAWKTSLKRKFYMSMTRAMSELVVVCEAEQLPEELSSLGKDAPGQRRRAPRAEDGNLVRGDGLVWDKSTGLEWQLEVPAKAMTWDEARAYSKDLALEGSGWRLPTRRELEGLLRPQWQPMIDRRVYSNTPAEWFWSGERDPADSGLAFAVSFRLADVRSWLRGNRMMVRCVRSR